MENGLIGGKIKAEEPVVITSGKNLGKSNATTPYTQAVCEAKAKVTDKLKKKYVEHLEDAKQNTLSSGIKEPMTAKKYDPTGKQNGSKTLEKFKIKGKKVHVQPKIDGNRNMAIVSSEGTKFYTRQGGVFPPLPHIEEQLNRRYKASGLTEPVILDGELYSTEYAFRVFNGILNSKTMGERELAVISTLDYYIYDTYSGETYDKRYETIKKFVGYDEPNLKLIPSEEVVAEDDILLKKLEEKLENGDEGLMIRTLDRGYENKRTDQLIKYKVFEDEEFEIVDLYASSMGNLGGFTVKLNEEVVDRDGKTLTTVNVGSKGIKHSEGREMLANKEKYIGKMATIEFFGRDPRPRFPKFKSIREDK
jgi:ATP-dependent DNA ligase